MQIATNDIVDKTLEHEGNYVNQDLFIAEANFKIGRPRIIQPVRAKLVPREEAPKNKTIYYSFNFFKYIKPMASLIVKLSPCLIIQDSVVIVVIQLAFLITMMKR